jgi:hypothetical protein
MRGQLTKKEIITIIIFMLIITTAVMLSLKFTLSDEKEVKICNLELVIENGTRSIPGYIINNSDKTIKYAEIELHMIHDYGITRIETCKIGKIGPGEKCRFTFYLFYLEFDYCNVKISKVEYK